MRPVNLIPVDERRGENAPLRSGPIAYLIVGALVLLLAGVTALILTGNQISDREAEVATLKAEDKREEARAERLVAYTQFRELGEQRVATVSNLADSRFDWERVMRELSLILPSDAWLTELKASAGGGEGGSAASGALGPALELSGCAAGQEAVAGFVTSLKDIDGVTRVGVQSSELPDKEAAGSGGGSSEGSSDECRTRNFISKFELVVAFDAAPVPLTEQAEVAPEAAQVTSTESEGG